MTGTEKFIDRAKLAEQIEKLFDATKYLKDEKGEYLFSSDNRHSPSKPKVMDALGVDEGDFSNWWQRKKSLQFQRRCTQHLIKIFKRDLGSRDPSRKSIYSHWVEEHYAEVELVRDRLQELLVEIDAAEERERANREDDPVEIRSSPYDAEPIPQVRRSALEKEVEKGLADAGWKLERMSHGQGCTNPDLNRLIVLKRPKFELRVLPDKWNALQHWDRDLLSVACSLRRGEIRDEAKIRIASDFFNQNRVTIQPTNFLSSVMTDQIAWTEVRTTELKKDGMTPKYVPWDGVNAFIDPTTGKIRSLGQAKISNQLGVSTIAFSRDGGLVVAYQNDINTQSANKLAPAGSGSMDWADVEKSKATDLLSLVEHGAERELREECGVTGGEVPVRIMCIAFARMLHRGGKPEFFCLGWLGSTAREVAADNPEKFIRSVHVPNSNRADWDAESPSKEILRVCADYLKATSAPESSAVLSYPLEHGLKLLIEACNSDAASAVDRFIRECQLSVRAARV